MLASLLELSDGHLPVEWPQGWTESAARKAVRERPPDDTPPPKRPRTQPPSEVARASDSTLVSARLKSAVRAAAVAKSSGPAVDAAPRYGAGHDLRQSGQMIWCRKCGRYGAVRMRSDGLGGRCEPEERNHTQLNRLMNGLHPIRKTPLPPEMPFYR